MYQEIELDESSSFEMIAMELERNMAELVSTFAAGMKVLEKKFERELELDMEEQLKSDPMNEIEAENDNQYVADNTHNDDQVDEGEDEELEAKINVKNQSEVYTSGEKAGNIDGCNYNGFCRVYASNFLDKGCIMFDEVLEGNQEAKKQLFTFDYKGFDGKSEQVFEQVVEEGSVFSEEELFLSGDQEMEEKANDKVHQEMCSSWVKAECLDELFCIDEQTCYYRILEGKPEKKGVIFTFEGHSVYDDKSECKVEEEFVSLRKFFKPDSIEHFKQRQVTSHACISFFNPVKNGVRILGLQNGFDDHAVNLFLFHELYGKKRVTASVYICERLLEFKRELTKVILKNVIRCGVKKDSHKMQRFQFDREKSLHVGNKSTNFPTYLSYFRSFVIAPRKPGCSALISKLRDGFEISKGREIEEKVPSGSIVKFHVGEEQIVPPLEFLGAERTIPEFRVFFSQSNKYEPSLPDAFSKLAEARDDESNALSALGGCLFYLKQTILDEHWFRITTFEMLPCSGLSAFAQKTYMFLNTGAFENLTISENNRSGDSSGTLYAQMNHCVTLFGKRLLKTWLARPLYHLELIRERQDPTVGLKIDSAVWVRLRLFHPLPPNSGLGVYRCAVERAISFITDELCYGIFAGTNPETFVRADGAFIPFAGAFDMNNITTSVQGFQEIGDVIKIDLQSPISSLFGKQVMKIGRLSGLSNGTILAYAFEYNDEKGILKRVALAMVESGPSKASTFRQL